MDHPPTKRLHLPCLATLTVDDAQFLSHIHAPSLTCLGINCSSSFDSLQSISSFTGVETLVLYGQPQSEVVPSALWDLSGVRLLIFHAPDSLGHLRPRIEYSVFVEFFEAMNEDARGFTWPRLRCIHFKGPHAGKRAFLPTWALLQFVQKRNAEHNASQRTARIEEIIIERPSDIDSEMDPETAVQLGQLTTLRGGVDSL